MNIIKYLNKYHNIQIYKSEEQGERFHQDVMVFERRYQGQYNENMMGYYIWGLIPESSYKHKKITTNIYF